MLHCIEAFNRRYKEMDTKMLALILFMDPRYKGLIPAGDDRSAPRVNFKEVMAEVGLPGFRTYPNFPPDSMWAGCPCSNPSLRKKN